MTRRLVLVSLALMLSGAACGDDTATTSVETTDATTTTASDSTTSQPEATTTTATAPAGMGEPLFDGLDASVTLLTASSGGGGRPLLEWEAVPGADLYVVFLYAPSGEVYWVWSGASTSVHVGGEPQLAEGSAGPSVAAGMSWAVVAHDADQLPIAVSELRPIDP